MFRNGAEGVEPTVPEQANPVDLLDVPQGWGLGFHVYQINLPGMRSAGSGDWSGFFDGKIVESILGFEAAAYAELGATVS